MSVRLDKSIDDLRKPICAKWFPGFKLLIPEVVVRNLDYKCLPGIGGPEPGPAHFLLVSPNTQPLKLRCHLEELVCACRKND